MVTMPYGYLTESMHGAGSPQAQRIQIYRHMQLDLKQRLAQRLAGIDLSDGVLLGTGAGASASVDSGTAD